MNSTKRLFILAIYLCSCSQNAYQDLKLKSDYLLEKIGDGQAQSEFPAKYFPPEKTNAILFDLDHKCDFKKGSGKYLGYTLYKDVFGNNRISFKYVFALKCAKIKITTTYYLKEVPELCEFRLEKA